MGPQPGPAAAGNGRGGNRRGEDRLNDAGRPGTEAAGDARDDHHGGSGLRTAREATAAEEQAEPEPLIRPPHGAAGTTAPDLT